MQVVNVLSVVFKTKKTRQKVRITLYRPCDRCGRVFTKADMAAMLEDLKKEMNPIKECEQQIYGKEHWNFVGKCQDVIQDKINEFEGEI